MSLMLGEQERTRNCRDDGEHESNAEIARHTPMCVVLMMGLF
ncbi:hypothetical protein ACRQ5Q_27605 [Bradyrhizobium sp. PMVTL-01]